MSDRVTEKFEYMVRPAEIGQDGYHAELHPTDDQLDALAKRFKISAIHSFDAVIDLVYHPDRGEIDVYGDIHARVEQPCVISLDPVETDIQGQFAETLVIEGQGTMPDPEDEETETADQLFIPIPAGPIDLAEIGIQNLSLLIPDYPRKEDATIDDQYITEQVKKADNPFAVLSELAED
jgi:uncharacterized metal-binding protein YceD (DUF177 family)